MTRRLALGVVVAALLGIVALPGMVSAQDPPPFALIREVDATDPDATRLTLVYPGGERDVDEARLRVNGEEVPIESSGLLPPEAPRRVAFVFDVSEAMDVSGALAAAKQAARDWVNAAAGTNVQYAVYTAGGAPELLQGFTASTQRALSAIDRVGPSINPATAEDTALWGAIRIAGAALSEERNAQHNLVVMTAQDDTVAPEDRSAATGAVTNARAMVLVAGYTGEGLALSQLQSLVDTAGGTLVSTGDPAAMGDAVGALEGVMGAGQYRVEFASPVPVGEVARLEMEVGGQTSRADVVMGSVAAGKPALTPDVVTTATGIAFLQGGLGLIVAIVLVLLAAAGLAYAVVMIFSPDNELQNTLKAYTEPYGGAPEGEAEGDGGSQSFATTAIIQRAVELTEQVAEERGILSRTEAMLERASLPLRAGEALFFYAALILVATFLGLFVLGGLFGGLLFGLLAAVAPVATVSFLAGRRQKKFKSQLPDTLQLLSGTLRAGYSLMQGVEAVSQEVEEPMGGELRRVVTESRLGRPLEEALEGSAARMDSPDFAWAVMAIRIQREVGGNLSELLLTVTETMRARERLYRDVQALTAEGRVSAMVLGILPVGLGGVMFVINPDYAGQLIHTTIGNIMLGVAIVSMLIGFVWMKKIINIEI